MSTPILKPPAKAYSPLERAVLAYANNPTEENAITLAGEIAKADVDLKASAFDSLARFRCVGPHEIAEAAALAVARRRRA